MDELIDSRTIISDEESDLQVVFKLYGSGLFAIVYQSHGTSACQEFTLNDISVFEEIVCRFMQAFDHAGDFSNQSFNVLDCFIDAQIDEICDQYFAYTKLSWL